jgi:hypothetical protein
VTVFGTWQHGVGATILLGIFLSSAQAVYGAENPSTTIIYGTAPPSATGIALTRAISNIDSIYARAATHADDAILDSAARLRFAIETLQHSRGDILDKRPKELNATQRKALEDIESGVAALQRAVEAPDDQIRERLKELRQLTTNLSPPSEQPAVVASSPAVLTPSDLNGGTLTLSGQRFAKTDPRLFFGDTEATRTELTDAEARFVLPAQALRSSDRNPVVYPGRALLSVRDCRWWGHCKPALQPYSVGVVMLPTHLATVRIGFDRKKNQRIYEQAPAPASAPASGSAPGAASTPPPARVDMVYRKRFQYSTEDLTVMTCTRETQGAHASGYSIDTETLSTAVVEHSGQTKWSLQDVSPSGFAIELCAQPQIDKMAKTPGTVTVEVTWKEFRMGDVVSSREWRQPEGLDWGAHIAESLPEDANTVEVDLDYFDGSHASFTQTANDRYVEMNWDPQQRQLVLTPHLRPRLPDTE